MSLLIILIIIALSSSHLHLIDAVKRFVTSSRASLFEILTTSKKRFCKCCRTQMLQFSYYPYTCKSCKIHFIAIFCLTQHIIFGKQGLQQLHKFMKQSLTVLANDFHEQGEFTKNTAIMKPTLPNSVAKQNVHTINNNCNKTETNERSTKEVLDTNNCHTPSSSSLHRNIEYAANMIIIQFEKDNTINEKLLASLCLDIFI